MTAETLFADRYRLERRLGTGGMATVQLALDTRLERYVAVKLLADHLAHDENFSARFRREALAAARLVHPNIVQVFDFGAEERSGRQFIVMEYVDGPSCAEILRELGRLAPEDAVSILIQSCRGLAYAHRNGVVHRDVKPGNLLRGRDDGQVKLADFGIAKAAEQSDITKVGSVLGTAAYLSPEQARGEQAGPASDLYALGVVSYQLLAGRLPFDAASLTDLARQQDAGPPPLLHELDPEIPRPLSRVVARTLEREPEDRFADAAELEQALAGAMRGVEPPPPTDATRALDETDATRALDRTAITTPLARTQAAPPRRRRLEPIDEPPRPQPARRSPAARPAAAPAQAARRPGGAWRALRTVLILAVLAAAAVGAYVVVTESGQRGVQLKEQVQGDVQQAVDEIQDLISDNTR
jgi:eukaryotic-like serine/threonine-protein kinase